ncbi:GNAT family N-acetyltransferase [Dokdonella sp.]|uniref:GNAT family N-acetyltransferase n=1 Tax=Dokdonella sp. TaxID=2291710 RepID=UPI002F40D360
MPGSCSTRPVRVADHDAWRHLWDGYNAFYGRSGATALAEATTRATWSRFLDDAEPLHAFVAEREGSLLGLAHCVLHPSTTAIAPSCYLQDLYTDEAARGSGVARALIETVCRFARQTGCARVYWQTHEDNAIARRLYDRMAERSGFIVYRRAP